jgi:hypothetical protein
MISPFFQSGAIGSLSLMTKGAEGDFGNLDNMALNGPMGGTRR